MNQLDKSDLINGLKDAMTKETEQKDRLVFDSVSIDRHNYARLVDIKDEKTEEQMYMKYPDSFKIRALITTLQASRESSMKKAADDLKLKFLTAAEAGDDRRVENIIKTSSELSDKLTSALSQPAMISLIYMMVADAINKL